MPEVQTLVRGILLMLPALALVLLTGYTVTIWQRLPDTVASHFDAEGVANGWSNKSSFVAMVLIVAYGTGAILYNQVRIHGNSVSIGIMYFVFAVIASVFWLSLRANVRDAPFGSIKVLLAGIGGLIFGVAAAWSMR